MDETNLNLELSLRAVPHEVLEPSLELSPVNWEKQGQEEGLDSQTIRRLDSWTVRQLDG